jgi:hypothetical protein
VSQVFRASEPFQFPNGAIGWRPGGPFDCLGPYAKVQNCPVEVGGVEVLRRTAYATGYADCAFSIPACTRVGGRYVRGFFTHRSDEGVVLVVMDTHRSIVEAFLNKHGLSRGE